LAASTIEFPKRLGYCVIDLISCSVIMWSWIVNLWSRWRLIVFSHSLQIRRTWLVGMIRFTLFSLQLGRLKPSLQSKRLYVTRLVMRSFLSAYFEFLCLKKFYEVVMVQVVVSKKCYDFFVVVETFWLFSILQSSIRFGGLHLVHHIVSFLCVWCDWCRF